MDLQETAYLALYHSNYKLTNKQRLQVRFFCPCGGKYLFKTKSTHNDSQRHIRYMVKCNYTKEIKHERFNKFKQKKADETFLEEMRTTKNPPLPFEPRPC